MQPTIGRVVHYSLPESYHGQGERLRPAFVVQVFPGDKPMANLSVFLDGLNDMREQGDLDALASVGQFKIGGAPILCVGSAIEGTAAGEWRWPARA